MTSGVRFENENSVAFNEYLAVWVRIWSIECCNQYFNKELSETCCQIKVHSSTNQVFKVGFICKILLLS